jgi:hypothetical protein
MASIKHGTVEHYIWERLFLLARTPQEAVDVVRFGAFISPPHFADPQNINAGLAVLRNKGWVNNVKGRGKSPDKWYALRCPYPKAWAKISGPQK